MMKAVRPQPLQLDAPQEVHQSIGSIQEDSQERTEKQEQYRDLTHAYEKKMADYLEIGPGSKVADIGCGRGRIAHHVASYTGAHVTGINIDKEQIRKAREYASSTGLLGKQVDFKVSNYNDPLPFENNSLDAAYYVQVLSYSTDLTAFFSEVLRVVKPGAKVAFEDYVLGPEYNASNPHHVELKKLYEVDEETLSSVISQFKNLDADGSGIFGQ